jgi:hypothetical protein
MKYLKDPSYVDADGAEDLAEPLAIVEGRAEALRTKLEALAAGDDPLARADALLELARTLVQLGKGVEAWAAAREAFDLYAAHEAWEGAVQCCDVLFASDQPQSLAALGQGIWLAVTFPIDPELTVAMLQHVIDETPPESDGAAVAATAALYVVDLRAPQGPERDNLLFYTNQLLATVARRHSNVHAQEEFEAWFRRLELDDPAKFLPRLRNVVDVLVQDDWWIDREALQAKLAVQ